MSDYLSIVKKARKKQVKLSIQARKDILKAYVTATSELRQRIRENQRLGLDTYYYTEIYVDINKMAEVLNHELSYCIKNHIYSSNAIATEMQAEFNYIVYPPNISVTANNFLEITNLTVVQKLISGEYYKDDKSLDHRIWNITNKNKHDIQNIIASNISKGANYKDLAEQLDNYVNPLAKTKRKTLAVSVNQDISYQATRLARTSITHTFNETTINNAKNNVFCEGLKWNLSASHYDRQIARWGPDICDDYANQDRFGLGNGVFPASDYPISHPNCLCYPTQVQPPIEDIIDRVNNWVDGNEDKKLDEAYSKWKSGVE